MLPSEASCEVSINLSVIPPNAETTTTMESFSDSIIFFTFSIFRAVPIEVPPNFITFIERLFFIVSVIQVFREFCKDIDLISACKIDISYFNDDSGDIRKLKPNLTIRLLFIVNAINCYLLESDSTIDLPAHGLFITEDVLAISTGPVSCNALADVPLIRANTALYTVSSELPKGCNV